ncbi:MAG: hypothetical protein QNJ46_12695 [Leptolyngbyaceae cyanobacterium MO_188.B28]|nr:hypothetical protein [Leptolyngbyaceae cyanobacterium MO_188.B28]
MFQGTESIDLPDFQDMHQEAPAPHQRISVPHQNGISDAKADASTIKFPASMKEVCRVIKAEFQFGFSENTLRTRWMPEKILPIYKGLDVPAIKNERGLITEFGFQVIRDYLVHTVITETGEDVDRMSLEAYTEYVHTLYPKTEGNGQSSRGGGFLSEEDYRQPGQLMIWEKGDVSAEVDRRKENANLAGQRLQQSVANYADVFLSEFDVLGKQLGARALERIQVNAQAVIQEGLTQGGINLGMTKKTQSPDFSNESAG